MYTTPDKNDPVDRLAHFLSEVHNNNAPLGWERYRSLARALIEKFNLSAAVMAATEGEASVTKPMDAMELVRLSLSLVFGHHPENVKAGACTDEEACMYLECELEKIPAGRYVPVPGRPDCADTWEPGVTIVNNNLSELPLTLGESSV